MEKSDSQKFTWTDVISMPRRMFMRMFKAQNPFKNSFNIDWDNILPHKPYGLLLKDQRVEDKKGRKGTVLTVVRNVKTNKVVGIFVLWDEPMYDLPLILPIVDKAPKFNPYIRSIN